MSTSLPRLTRLLLASYPPSFKERYGDELAALLEDRGTVGTTGNLLSGSLRAWVRPALGPDGPEPDERRLLATASTVWVAWVAGFFGGGAWLRGVTDGIVPALRSPFGWTVYLYGRAAFTIGWLSIAAIVLTLFGLVLRDSLQSRSLAALRPLRGFLILLTAFAGATLALAGLAHIGAAHTRGHHLAPDAWFAVAGIGWLLLAVAMAGSGMIGPIRALRGSRLSPVVLQRALRLALLPVAALAGLALAAALVSVYEATRHEIAGWGADVVAAAGLTVAASIAVVSYLRALPALQKPVGSRTV